MATNLAINLPEDNMLAQVTGPDDLKNFFSHGPSWGPSIVGQ